MNSYRCGNCGYEIPITEVYKRLTLKGFKTVAKILLLVLGLPFALIRDLLTGDLGSSLSAQALMAYKVGANEFIPCPRCGARQRWM